MDNKKSLADSHIENDQQQKLNGSNEFKLKILLDYDNYDLVNTPIDYEDEDQFGLGMLLMHRLIDDNFKITSKGEEMYQKEVRELLQFMKIETPTKENKVESHDCHPQKLFYFKCPINFIKI